MDHFLYIAASGARETMLAQAANTHNLSNASTTAFRADLVTAQSAYLSGEGHESRAFAGMKGRGVDFKEGVINATGRELDIAINGPGWMAVEAPDGSEALSRRGDFRVNELGQLLNGAGQSVLGNAGPVAIPPYTNITIGADGSVSIVPLGEDPNTLTVVDRIKLVNPDTDMLAKNPNGLVQMIDGEETLPDASVNLVSGSLESSNVNSVESMVQMIELARQFETHVKMMKTAEELDSSSAKLMSMN
jgi:flagellar basal-body rod protein FlgF